MKRTTLYRLYDDNDELLYVGIAGNPGRRFDQHAADKAWWEDVASSRMKHYPTREGAAAAEREAIRSEDPRHNVVHKLSLSAATRGQIRGMCGMCGTTIDPSGSGFIYVGATAVQYVMRDQAAAPEGAHWVASCGECGPAHDPWLLSIIELGALTHWVDLVGHTAEILSEEWGRATNWTRILTALAATGDGFCLVVADAPPVTSAARFDPPHDLEII